MIQKIKCLLGIHEIDTKTTVIGNKYKRDYDNIYIPVVKTRYCMYCGKILGDGGVEMMEIKEKMYD